ncbi:hypothetical protein BDN70DRAFT_918215 [Pholiota conissans]|uniref:Uncharacterized protein n=1 Tax=Pholiota conissans TaxID=109636 RepID=A0A9P6CY31_9AGAR|nr:hypothetical protein BDN70DRAFT_918215 [Pholiota conissans]
MLCPSLKSFASKASDLWYRIHRWWTVPDLTDIKGRHYIERPAGGQWIPQYFSHMRFFFASDGGFEACSKNFTVLQVKLYKQTRVLGPNPGPEYVIIAKIRGPCGIVYYMDFKRLSKPEWLALPLGSQWPIHRSTHSLPTTTLPLNPAWFEDNGPDKNINIIELPEPPAPCQCSASEDSFVTNEIPAPTLSQSCTNTKDLLAIAGKNVPDDVACPVYEPSCIYSSNKVCRTLKFRKHPVPFCELVVLAYVLYHSKVLYHVFSFDNSAYACTFAKVLEEVFEPDVTVNTKVKVPTNVLCDAHPFVEEFQEGRELFKNLIREIEENNAAPAKVSEDAKTGELVDVTDTESSASRRI